jgi:small subunit ribosomal protein S16
MTTKIRLARAGSKKRPFYKVVIADSRSPRDGKFIEKLGTYNPLLAKDNAERVVLKTERVQYWLSVGAQPTERVAKFIEAAGINLPGAKAKKPAATTEKKASAKKTKAA